MTPTVGSEYRERGLCRLSQLIERERVHGNAKNAFLILPSHGY